MPAMNADGDIAFVLADEGPSSIALPVVSKDGESIAYFCDHLFTVPVDGGEPVQLTLWTTGAATLPAWSRSNNSIYYYKDRALYRIDPATAANDPVLDDVHWSSRNWLAVHAPTNLAPPYSIRGKI